MKCPRCGGTLFENYEVLRTVGVVGVDAEGYPVQGNDAEDLTVEVTVYSYNCADCAIEWDTWSDLYTEIIEARTP